MKLSYALADDQTALMVSRFTGGFVRLFTGAPPVNSDQAETGTLLGVVSVNAQAGAGLHFVNTGPALQKAEENWAFKALATGTVGWFRLVQPGDSGGNSLTARRLDGVVGLLTEAADMNWETLDVAVDQFYTIESFLYLIQPV
jgi:hypothetical protein